MEIRPALRNVLEIVGRLAHYDINTNVVDTTVVQHSSSHSSLEVYDCLEELETLGLIKMLQPIGDTKEKKDSETFRLLNITKEGLEKLRQNEKKIK
jgi:small nuclear ribonucleoprotein (snRNP)-like protein